MRDAQADVRRSWASCACDGWAGRGEGVGADEEHHAGHGHLHGDDRAGDGEAHELPAADGKTLVTARARYSGVAAGDGNLAGPITLDARIVANETDSIGVVDGKLRIQVATGGETAARFTEVWASGKLVGFATGHTGEPHAKLFANFSSGFVPATGFTGGKIGATDGGSAVEVGPGSVIRRRPCPRREAEARAACPGREAEARTGRPGCEEGSRQARRKGQEELDEAESARNGSSGRESRRPLRHVATP